MYVIFFIIIIIIIIIMFFSLFYSCSILSLSHSLLLFLSYRYYSYYCNYYHHSYIHAYMNMLLLFVVTIINDLMIIIHIILYMRIRRMSCPCRKYPTPAAQKSTFPPLFLKKKKISDHDLHPLGSFIPKILGFIFNLAVQQDDIKNH